MHGQFRLVCCAACDYRRDYGLAVVVTGVVLNNQHGAAAALFRTDAKRQVGVKYIAAPYFSLHSWHNSFHKYKLAERLCRPKRAPSRRRKNGTGILPQTAGLALRPI
jgi:hypothetical protein